MFTQQIVRFRTVLGKEGSLKNRVISGGLWSLIGGVVSYGAAFIASVVAAQLLGTSGFGEFGMLRNTVTTLGIFAGLGLGLTGTKYVAEFRTIDREKTARIIHLSIRTALVSGLILSTILILSASFVAREVLSAPHLTNALLVASAVLFVQAYDGAQKGVLAGFEAYRETAVIYLVGGITTFAGVLLGVWFFKVTGGLLGYLIGTSAMVILNYLEIQRQWQRHNLPRRTTNIWSESQILSEFTLPALLGGILISPTNWLVNIILVNQPGGYAQMGILTAVLQLKSIAIFIPRNALKVLLPVMSMELNKDSLKSTNRRLLIANSYIAFYFSTCAVTILLFFVEPLLKMFGSEFADGRLAMVFILSSLPLITYQDGISRFIQAKSFLWYGFAGNLFWAIVLLASTTLLVNQGAVGVSLAYLVAYGLNTLIFVPIYYKRLDMGRQVLHDALLGFLLLCAVVPAAITNLVNVSLTTTVALGSVSAIFIGLATVTIWGWLKE